MNQNKLPDVSSLCTFNLDRSHCGCYHKDGSCCDCRRVPPGMCPNRCGQPLDNHDPECCINNYKSPVFDLVAHLKNQREHSFKTFGPPDAGQKVQGIIKHLRKEIDEVEKDPSDLEEWIDVVILAFDGAYRSGYTPEQIVTMLMQKQVKNERRKWPDWREVDLSKPLEHVREE